MQNESKWEHELALLKHILDSMPLEKATKWGADVYTYKGKNVVSYGGFKHHFALWFFNGVFLKDPHKLLCATSDNTKALRKMEFNNKAQINEAAIREYIYEAIEVEKLGLKIKPEKHSPVEIPLLLKEAFDANEPLKKAFETLSSGKQKEYCIHINEAKQESTKLKRIEKIIPLIFEGKGLHDKYKK